MTDPARERLRVRLASVLGGLVGSCAFYLTLLNYSWNFGRTALSIPFAANYFELQARAILAGHLDVPTGSLGIEGFVVHHKTYMYFGPFPALLRIPVMLVTGEFDGRMTLVSMGVAFAVYAVMATRLFWTVRALVLPDRPLTRFGAVMSAVFLALVTGGTALTFDASLPWVYHEVYLWQSALVVSAVYWMIRMVQRPAMDALRMVGLLALCASLTRITGGFGVILGILCLAGWFWWRGRHGDAEARRWARWVLVAALVPLVVAVTYNYAKFGHPYMFPLQDQVWTSVNAHRREALARNGGTLTGLQFFWTSLVNYFGPGQVRFVGYFPWVTLPAHDARGYGAFLDQSYRTGSVTAFSTGLLVLAVVGFAAFVVRRRALAPLAFPLVATLAMTGGVMAYGYVAFRYTSEFVPGLVLLGSIGFWTLAGWRPRRSLVRPLRALGAAGLTLATAFALGANMAVGYASAAVTAEGAPLQRYVADQDAVSGGPGTAFSRLVSASDTGPPPGSTHTDALHIEGACDALYLNTGDATQPWVLVEGRSRTVSISIGAHPQAGSFLLWTVRTAEHTRTVWVQSNRRHQLRVFLVNEGGRYYGPWFDVAPQQTVTVGFGYQPEFSAAEVSSAPGGFVGYVPVEEWSSSWVRGEAQVTDSLSGPRTAGGVSLRPSRGLPLPLCEQLVRHNDVPLPAG